METIGYPGRDALRIHAAHAREDARAGRAVRVARATLAALDAQAHDVADLFARVDALDRQIAPDDDLGPPCAECGEPDIAHPVDLDRAEDWQPQHRYRETSTPARSVLSDASAVDRLAEWFRENTDDDGWGSACDFIEHAAEVIRLTGRDIDPVTPDVIYYAGARYHIGTCLPSNVTGECDHEHATAAEAQECIDDLDAAIKRGNGRAAYCDRVVMVWHAGGGGARHPRSEPCEECS